MVAPAHVLVDADGVLQEVAAGWRPVVDRLLGAHAEDFVAALPGAEAASLVGVDDFPDPRLGRLLGDLGSPADPEELYAVLWLSLAVSTPTLEVVADLRAAGLGVHLATNQHRRRAAYMREELRYPDVFDRCYWSCDLGVAKPDPAYFETVLADLGVEPGAVLLVDDSAANVEGARGVGLRAVRWELSEGHDVLRSRLRALGALPAG